MSLCSDKHLIICADDFGMSAGVNRCVVHAHREGIVTDASLMVGGVGFEEAVELARQHPSLRVGLHLVLVQGYPVSPVECIPGLVGRDGRFRNDPISGGLRYFSVPGIRAQLRREIEAQLERFLGTGLPLCHLAGHMHVHMHPAVLEIVIELASRYGLRAVRLTREPVASALRFDRRHATRKIFEAGIFSVLSRYAVRRLSQAGIRHPLRMFGLHQTGQVSEAYLLEVMRNLGASITEVYCHLGERDQETRRWWPESYQPDLEVAAVTSPQVRAGIEKNQIKLISYKDLSGISG